MDKEIKQLDGSLRTVSTVEEGVATQQSTRDGDEALKFLQRSEQGDELSQVNETKLVRKIDFHIVPLMFAAYFLQYLDKS